MKTWSEIPAGELNAASQRLWVALGENAQKVVTRINNVPGFVDTIAQFALKDECGASVFQNRNLSPIDDTDRQIREEFNLDPDRIATSLADETKKLGVDPTQAFLYLQARLPIVVSDSLQTAERILLSRNVI